MTHKGIQSNADAARRRQVEEERIKEEEEEKKKERQRKKEKTDDLFFSCSCGCAAVKCPAEEGRETRDRKSTQKWRFRERKGNEMQP